MTMIRALISSLSTTNVGSAFRSNLCVSITRFSSLSSNSSSNSSESASPETMEDLSAQRLVWVDCEMSGLDPQIDQLLEVAAVITDSQLNDVDCLGPLVIKTDLAVLNAMGEWCQKQHAKTGLIEACLSENALPLNIVDEKLADFLLKNHIKKGILAGNSIHTDRLFLDTYCPKFTGLLHYRLVDVSSIKELMKRWYPSADNSEVKSHLFDKKMVHRALDDIRESIAELRFYREKYFVK